MYGKLLADILIVLAILVIMLVPLAVMIMFRILNEEEALLGELPGYREYYGKVRYRLVPGVWGTSRYSNLPVAITPAASQQLSVPLASARSRTATRSVALSSCLSLRNRTHLSGASGSLP